MKRPDVYVDVDGNVLWLSGLDAAERQLVGRLRRRARTHPDWTDFGNYWTRAVAAFYDARGMSRKRSSRTVPYRIAQDLSGRLGIASGLVRSDDCAGDVEWLIREQFPSLAAFCKATGLEEKGLRQFLVGRGEMSVTALQEGLERIGYGLRVRPLPAEARRAKSSKARVG
jgi:hypothetical protein